MTKKNLIEIILHFLLWMFATYFFISNSFLRVKSADVIEEYCSILLIIAVVYINYYWLIPYFFSRNKLLQYVLLLITLLLLITTLEFIMLYDDIKGRFSVIDESIYFHFNMIYFGILFRDLLFIAFFTMFRIYRDAVNAYKLLKEKTELEQQKMKIELNLVKSKVNSHFLFNTLNGIYALALERSEKTADMVVNLSELMHYVVQDNENEYVPLAKEIEFLDNYIALETARHLKLDVQFNVNGSTSEIRVPPMIFEAYVNNAFKYVNNDGSGFIYINLECRNDNTIIFTCENNTRTTQAMTEVKSTKKGLVNNKDRLNQLYKDKHKLDNYFENGIYKARLELMS